MATPRPSAQAQKPAPSLDAQVGTLEVINKEITDRLARQSTSMAQIDTKAALIAGVAATAAQFLAGRKDPDPAALFAVVAYCAYAYACAFLAAVRAYSLARYTDVPDPRALVTTLAQLPKAEVFARLAATRTDAFEANQRKHRRKAVSWWVSVVALALGLASSTVAIVQTG
jgi:hypothetical protein